jgi:N-acylglucosamine-6-phosphate 2-epimerase
MVNRKTWDSIARLEGGLIASCQASSGEPLCRPEHIVALALSALNGGAVGLRLEGADNIRAARECRQIAKSVPIIGLIKSESVADEDRLQKVYITNTFAEARMIADAGADIVALDATGRERPDGLTVEETIRRIHTELDKPVWADVARFAEGVAAESAGADVVSTTLYGYTEETTPPWQDGPALELIKDLAENLRVPIVLEGRVWEPREVTAAFEHGAFAVVVGSAITRPRLITERFVKAIPLGRSKRPTT